MAKFLFICLTFLLSSLPVFFILRTQLKVGKESDKELMIFALGMGPILISLLLYYEFTLIPGQNPFFYISATALLLLIMLVLSLLKDKKNKPGNLDSLQLPVDQENDLFFKPHSNTKKNVFYWLSLFLLVLYLIPSAYYIFTEPILGHDVLEYGVLGKYLALNGEINYKELNYFPGTGFFYVGLHAYGFALFSSWEHLFNMVFGIQSDYYFRSITFYYGLLLLLLVFEITKSTPYIYRLMTLVALLLNAGFMSLVFNHHLDSTRIFLQLAVFFVFFKYTANGSKKYLILFACLSGMLSFIHSLGFISTILFSIIIFFYIKHPLQQRIRMMLQVALIILFTGAIHYVIDTFWGSGWIFNSQLKFF